MNGNRFSLMLALLAPLMLPVGAFSQTAAPTTAASTATPGHNEPGTVQQRIDQLHTLLEITPAEQPQWNRFAQAMAENASGMHKAFEKRGAALGTMNAAENMESYAELSAMHAQNMQSLASTFHALYLVMTPEQKQNADVVFRSDETAVGHHHAAAKAQ